MGRVALAHGLWVSGWVSGSVCQHNTGPTGVPACSLSLQVYHLFIRSLYCNTCMRRPGGFPEAWGSCR